MTLSSIRQVLLCFALVFSTAGHSAEKPRNNQIDPFVEQLVRQASDYLSQAKSYSMHSNVITEEVLPSGQKIQLSRSARVLVRLPDRLYAEVMSDLGMTRFYYNGKKISRFDVDNNVYGSIKVPGTLEAALDHAMEKFHLDAPLADFFAGNLYDNFITNTDSAFYAGLHYMQGNMYHHLALSNENVDFQIWITDDVAPLINKVVITYKHLSGEPQFTAYLTDWDFNPGTPDMVFEFYPPIDAEEIQFLPVASGKRAGGK